MTTRINKTFVFVTAAISIVFVVAGVCSHFKSVGIFSVASDTHFRVDRGVVKVWHITGLGPTITAEQWPGDPIPSQRLVPPHPRFPWFAFSSGHERGMTSEGAGSVTVATYSICYFPIWILAIVFSLPSIRSLYIRLRHRPANHALQMTSTQAT
jgi:hypothetical protein